MFYSANDWLVGAHHVFFLHMILMDSVSETAMCLGRTSIVMSSGGQVLNAANLDLVIK